MKTIMCYVAAAIIYAAVIGSIVCGIIAMICGVYYGNIISVIIGYVVFILSLIMWSMLQKI